ncbi:hypothetical protein HY490_01880, partial [Candidatus Woesearchaeota archaeon]|nr:hypothetical protein [Candidatus Woesearchaeota archaeon]
CTDSDGGPTNLNEPKDYIQKAGTATVAASSSKDYCITSIDGSKTERGAYIREFYCKSGKAQAVDYKCEDYHAGTCVTVAGSSYCTITSTQAAPDVCGDKKLNKPEECDPPDSICIDKDNWPGLCSKTCTCAPYKKATAECGNKKLDDGEACEQDKDCTQATCTNCTCVPIPPPTNQTSTEPTPSTHPAPIPLPVVPPANETIIPLKKFEPIQPIAFNESIGIRLSYQVASFGHALWAWIIEVW